jgi:monomeric sarcosine oxidase
VSERYDAVVIGGGALGSASAYWLTREARAGRVLVLEQFSFAHRLGASEDRSRIIRRAYDQGHYVRLTEAMYEAWTEVEEEAEAKVVDLCGGLDLADRGGEAESVVRATAEEMAALDVAHEWLDAEQLRRPFPAFVVSDDVLALFHPEAGVLSIDKATSVLRDLARRRGATLWQGAHVDRIEVGSDSVIIWTDDGRRIDSARAVVCAGRWTNRVLSQVGTRLPLRYTREQVDYFHCSRPQLFSPERMPVWIWHGAVNDGEQEHYGFPADSRGAVKVVGHYGPWCTEVPDVLPVDVARTEAVRTFIGQHLPDIDGPSVESRACMYELTPDHDFVLGPVPGCPQLVVGVGAGHAAKFAALAGRILAELAATGETAFPVDAFRVDRPALTDPRICPTMPGWPQESDPRDTGLPAGALQAP